MKTVFSNDRNPLLPLYIHLADSEAHVMPDGKLYLYGSIDKYKDQFCSEQYHVICTADMNIWEIYDTSFSSEKLTWEIEYDISNLKNIDLEHPTPFLRMCIEQSENNENMIEKENEAVKQLLYAPDGVFYNGMYYLFFCMIGGKEGVAFSNHPAGPFSKPVMLPCRGIDPAIFVEKGVGYYFWGQFQLNGTILSKDMKSFSCGEIHKDILTEEEHCFHEGASIRKINDKYYMVYTDMERGKPSALGYAIANHPFGPYHYQGIIIDNDGCDPQTWNNHGSIERFQGKWYVFYHRSSRNSKVFRRLCVEPIEIDENGLIKEVVMTSQGAGKPFSLIEDIMAYQACQMHGKVFIDEDESYGEKLTGIANGDIVYFRYMHAKKMIESVNFECEGSGQIEVILNQQKCGCIQIVNGWQKNISVRAEPGVYEIVLKFREVNNLSVHKFTFNKSDEFIK